MKCINCLRTNYSDDKSTPGKLVYWCGVTGKDIEDVSASTSCDKGQTSKQLREKWDKKK
jgi:hypothetical protein